MGKLLPLCHFRPTKGFDFLVGNEGKLYSLCMPVYLKVKSERVKGEEENETEV